MPDEKPSDRLNDTPLPIPPLHLRRHVSHTREHKKRYAPAQPEHTPRFTYLLSELLQQSVELLLQHCLCCGTYELINELAVLEEEQGRDSAHTVV